MANVHIRIHNKEYDIACDDGQEEHLRFLADEVDDRVRQLIYSMGGHPGETKALLLAALMLVDELADSKEETRQAADEVDRLSALVSNQAHAARPERMVEIENAMAVTLEEIAQRIERIAEQIEPADA